MEVEKIAWPSFKDLPTWPGIDEIPTWPGIDEQTNNLIMNKKKGLTPAQLLEKRKLAQIKKGLRKTEEGLLIALNAFRVIDSDKISDDVKSLTEALNTTRELIEKYNKSKALPIKQFNHE